MFKKQDIMLSVLNREEYKSVEILRDNRGRSISFLVMAAVLWSFGGLILKRIEWNPVAVAGMRAAFAALTMLVVVRKPRFTWSFAQIGGAVCYCATVILYVSSNKLTTAANAIMLQYTSVIYIVILAAWFLKEKTVFRDWTTVFTVIVGMILFFLGDITPGRLEGNILAAISGLTYACCVIFMRIQKDGSPMETILLGNIMTALISLPFVFKTAPHVSTLACLGFLGIFQIGLPYILYSEAVKHATALEVASIPMIEPVLNPLWVFLAIGEVPGMWAVTGGIVVLVSVVIRCVVSVKYSNEI